MPRWQRLLLYVFAVTVLACANAHSLCPKPPALQPLYAACFY